MSMKSCLMLLTSWTVEGKSCTCLNISFVLSLSEFLLATIMNRVFLGTKSGGSPVQANKLLLIRLGASKKSKVSEIKTKYGGAWAAVRVTYLP